MRTAPPSPTSPSPRSRSRDPGSPGSLPRRGPPPLLREFDLQPGVGGVLARTLAKLHLEDYPLDLTDDIAQLPHLRTDTRKGAAPLRSLWLVDGTIRPSLERDRDSGNPVDFLPRARACRRWFYGGRYLYVEMWYLDPYYDRLRSGECAEAAADGGGGTAESYEETAQCWMDEWLRYYSEQLHPEPASGYSTLPWDPVRWWQTNMQRPPFGILAKIPLSAWRRAYDLGILDNPPAE